MGAIFGKKAKSKQQSQSTQNSYNQAYNPLLEAYKPLLSYANEGATKYKAFLDGDRTGFDAFLKNSGYDYDNERGIGAIGAGIRQQGLRNSGAALKRLTQFKSTLDNTYSNNYLDRLMNMMGIGNTAGQLLSGAGGYSTGQSTSSGTSTGPKKGLLDYAANAASAVAAGG